MKLWTYGFCLNKKVSAKGILTEYLMPQHIDIVSGEYIKFVRLSIFKGIVNVFSCDS